MVGGVRWKGAAMLGAIVPAVATAGCGGGGTPAAAPRPCPAAQPTGPGLWTGVVAFSAAGGVVGASRWPSPLYTPEPGDANLAIIPGTIVVVVGTASPPTSADPDVLAPLPQPTTAPGGQPGTGFAARREGCTLLDIGGHQYSVSVRSPVS